MLRFKFILFQIAVVCNFCFSQTNLVSNPGFENKTSCPTFMLQWDKCIGWNNCNGNVGNGLWGTPDYFHTCGTPSPPYNSVPPNTGNGVCSPHGGSAMMGLVCYNTPYPNYREYISTQLSCPMTAGNTYTVSFWITASSAPTVKYNSSHFGVYLSNTAPIQSTYLVINTTPQYEITTIINNVTWQQHTFTISPTSNLNYITLGCFRIESVISAVVATPSAGQPYSNYFIDDIEVLSSASSGTNSIIPSIANVKCHGASNGSATVTATGSGNSYLWSPGGYTTASVNNLSAGIYSVSVSNGGCSATTLTLSINEPPLLTGNLSSATPSICAGQSAIINANSSGGTQPYTINWSTGNFNTSSVSVSPTSGSVYSYTVTDFNLCSKSSSISVTVSSPPIIGLNTQNICSGTTTTLIATGASSYSWLPGNNTGSTNVVSLSSPLVYSVTGTSSLNCSTTSTFNIVVNQSPTITVNSSSMCVGQTATLNAVSSNGTYTWMPGGQISSSVLVSPNVTTNYSVSSAINSCSSTAIASVVVYPKPAIITATTVVACLGQSKILSVTGANTYTWLPGNSTGNSISILPVSPSQYTVLGTSLGGCVNSQIINVNTVNSLTVNLNPVVICKGQDVSLVANTNGNKFQWKPVALVQSPNSISTVANPTATTVFTFETSDNGFCTTTATTNVIVNDKPNVFVGKDTIINIGESIVLTGNSNYDFGWKTFDGNLLSCNYCSSVSVSPQQSTCYLLESVTSQGCKSQDTLCVIVTKDWSIYIPNAFTPNNDLTNDLFLPYGYGIVDYELYIFDRWGEQIFKSDADHRGWNGYYKNEICEMGVYTYMLIVNTYSKKEEKKIGHVTLLK